MKPEKKAPEQDDVDEARVHAVHRCYKNFLVTRKRGLLPEILEGKLRGQPDPERHGRK